MEIKEQCRKLRGSECEGEARSMRGDLNRHGMQGWPRKKGEGA